MQPKVGSTPGPWHIKRMGKQMYIESNNENGSGGFVCDMQLGDSMQEDHECIEKDARLIAAAPELLEALKQVVAAEWTRTEKLTYDEQNLVKLAKQAIAKATGE